jgi:hypothetical protein
VLAHRYLVRLYYRLGDFAKSHEHQEALARLRENKNGSSPA